MGIFNEISQTVLGASGQTETNFDVVLSKYASKAQLEKISRECFRKGQDLDMGGHKIVGVGMGSGGNHVPTIKQIADTFFPARANKDLNMNKKYIRGLETDLDDPTSAVNKKSLQQKIDIQKRDFATADEDIKKELQKELSDAETELRNDLATKAAMTTAKSELRQELASKAFVAAGEAELRKDIHNQYLRPIHLTQLENKIDAKISALPQSVGTSGGSESYSKSEVDAKFDELPGTMDAKIQEVVNDDGYKRGLRRFVDKSARKKYEKKQAASFLARVKPGYYKEGEDFKVRWLSDDVYNNDDIEEDRDNWTLTLDPKDAAQHETLYLFGVHLVFHGSEEEKRIGQIQIKLEINQLGASKVVAFTRVRTENKDEITLFHVERIRNSATCSFVFNHSGYGGFVGGVKLNEKSRIAVVELQKPTHSLFRFLQSIGKDIQYSIRDYGSELDFSEQMWVIDHELVTTKVIIFGERNIIGLSQKKIVANIDIELNGITCFIECYTWNDFGQEVYDTHIGTTIWKREYSDVLSNGTQEVEFQMGYIARYVLFLIRGDAAQHEGYVLNKFTLTPAEQYQHVYLSPPVTLFPPENTYTYSLGGLFGMSTYPIAPRITPIPIGLPDNEMTRYDKKRPFEIEGKILHSPGNGFQQWIKFKKRCTPTFIVRLCTGGESGSTPPYISCYKKGYAPTTSTEILETRKSVSFSGQNEVEMSQTFEQNDEIFFGAVAPSGIVWLVSPMSSVNVIEVKIKFEEAP